MTTDDFIDAATSAYEDYVRTPKMNVGTFRDRIAEAYMDAAEWARTYLAEQEGHRRVRKYADDWDTCTCGYDAWPCRSQEPTDAEVEAAKAVLDSVEYADEPQSIRAALSAARAARRDEEIA